MKRIIKNMEPAELRDWKANYTARNGKTLQDIYEEESMTGGKLWRILRSSQNENTAYSKEELKTSLIVEQGSICCYCNREIEQNKAVIEHFMPKGMPEYFHLVYDYENLLASCDGFQSDPKPREVCCDAKRLQNEILPLKPTGTDIETHFTYTIDGQIIGLTDTAQQMISQLGLDITTLDSLRAAYIKDAIFENPFETTGTIFIDEKTAEQKIQTLQTLSNSKFTPFCAAIINVLRREVLNQ